MIGSVRVLPLRASLALLAAISVQGCFEAPPVDTEQTGFRGTAMETVKDPERSETLMALNTLPEALPAASADGPKASDIYENVQVLGDLSVGEFTRTMQAITNWVSPEQGCAYCHEGNNFAADDLYTKVVSRRMMVMTQHINAEWQDHVGDTGVTCLTCHRGKNVPEYIWFEQDGPKTAAGFTANSYQQNHVAEDVGKHSMLSDPFSKYLTADQAQIRVISQNPLPLKGVKTNEPTQSTENTYSLMFHLSNALGENCTYCHNTRAFTSWEQSPPARVTAWYGLRMVPSLNVEYLEPLGPTYPEHRLGELGDAPKVNCTTCHQGVNKPFYGESMLDDYPIWRGNPGAAQKPTAAIPTEDAGQGPVIASPLLDNSERADASKTLGPVQDNPHRTVVQ